MRQARLPPWGAGGGGRGRGAVDGGSCASSRQPQLQASCAACDPVPLPRSSLCIIDEFGKGTAAADGLGLLCATLAHLAGGPARPPRTVLCTHFR